jgi:hypothetical protein
MASSVFLKRLADCLARQVESDAEEDQLDQGSNDSDHETTHRWFPPYRAEKRNRKEPVRTPQKHQARVRRSLKMVGGRQVCVLGECATGDTALTFESPIENGSAKAAWFGKSGH